MKYKYHFRITFINTLKKLKQDLKGKKSGSDKSPPPSEKPKRLQKTCNDYYTALEVLQLICRKNYTKKKIKSQISGSF